MARKDRGLRPDRDFADFVATLTARKDTLPKRLSQVAQFVLNNPEDAALYNIVDLSSLADVPSATFTRFAKEMGFSGFPEMQEVFRQRLVGPRMSYADRIKALADAAGRDSGNEIDLKQPDAIFDTFIQTGIDSLLRLREEVDRKSLKKFVGALAKCESLHIAAARGAYGVGAYTFYGLSKVGKPVHMIDNLGAMRMAQINAVGKRDAVLVMTFDDYTPETVAIAELAAERKRPVLAITDNELSPVAALADQVLYVKEARLGHFRSQVPALVLCQSIIVALGRRTSRKA